MLFMALVCTTVISGQQVWLTAVHDKFILSTVRYATNNPKMNECYNKQFLSIKSGCYNEHRCYNECRGIQLADITCTCA